MDKEFPMVTVIVPTRPGQGTVAALEAARQLEYPRSRLEIIVARGRQPAIQRNHALRAAKGELVYFLDDDSVPAAGNLQIALGHFRESAVKVVGGPNLCPPQAPALEQVFAVCLGSWLAFGPSRARYDKVGQVRTSSEKELILCNLMARRRALLDLGGFDESLYPNEENALMDELQKRGGKLLYDPEFYVHRRPRPDLKAFCKMLMTYGRGRAEQFRLHPTPGSALNFVPPAFCAYLVGLGGVGIAQPAWLSWAALPLIPYAGALLLQTIFSAARHGVARGAGALFLVFLTHLLYGAGFWRGLFTKPGRSGQAVAGEVQLEIIAPT